MNTRKWRPDAIRVFGIRCPGTLDRRSLPRGCILWTCCPAVRRKSRTGTWRRHCTVDSSSGAIWKAWCGRSALFLKADDKNGFNFFRFGTTWRCNVLYVEEKVKRKKNADGYRTHRRRTTAITEPLWVPQNEPERRLWLLLFGGPVVVCCPSADSGPDASRKIRPCCLQVSRVRGCLGRLTAVAAATTKAHRKRHKIRKLRAAARQW